MRARLTAMHEAVRAPPVGGAGRVPGRRAEGQAADARADLRCATTWRRSSRMTYIAPFSVGASPRHDAAWSSISTLAFPIIDLLLGGMGAASPDARELSEIEEEIMQRPDLADRAAGRDCMGHARDVADGDRRECKSVDARAGLPAERKDDAGQVRDGDCRARPGRSNSRFRPHSSSYLLKQRKAGPAAEEGRGALLPADQHSRAHSGLRCDGRGRPAEHEGLGARPDRAAAGMCAEAARAGAQRRAC